MADRDALMREAERRLQDQLRDRTSPSNEGTPTLTAKLIAQAQTVEQAVDQLLPLLTAVKSQTEFVRDWRVVRSPQDHDSGTGLNVIEQPEEFIEFLRSERNVSDDRFRLSVLAFSDIIFPDDPSSYSAQISYAGGMLKGGFNTLTFSARAPRPGDTLSFDQWVALINLIVSWRETKYVSVGPASYGIHNAVFGQRAWDGWIGWFPVQIDPSTLPNWAIVQSVGTGTLVASQDRTVRADRLDDLERAAAVEMALADLGVLPLRRELTQ